VPRKMAIALTLVLLALVAWVVLVESNSFSIVINGQPVTGPFKGTVGVAGLIAAVVAGSCAAVILLFVFAGIWVVLLGGILLGGLAFAWAAFPFLLPVLIPLAILWLFVAIARVSKKVT
jgi:hypothetical protein